MQQDSKFAQALASAPPYEPSVQLAGQYASAPTFNSPQYGGAPNGLQYGTPIPSIIHSGLSQGAPFQVIQQGAPQHPTYVYVVPESHHRGHHHPRNDRLEIGNDPRYQCCCGACCHVTMCAYVIGILEAIGLILGLASSIVEYQEWLGITPDSSWTLYYQFLTTYFRSTMIGCAIAFALGVIVLIALFVGLIRQKAILVLPHLMYQVISVMGLLIGIGYSVYLAATGGIPIPIDNDQVDTSTVSLIFGITISLALMIALAIQFGFLINMIRCFQYLKRKRGGLW